MSAHRNVQIGWSFDGHCREFDDANAAPSTDHPNAPLRVLAVDPDNDARALYRQTLGVEGCDLIEGFDGRDGLVKASVDWLRRFRAPR